VLAQAGLLRAEGAAYRLEPKLRVETRRRIEAAPVDPEAAILSYVQYYGRITRREVMELCQVDGPQAYRLLKKQVDAGRLQPVGSRTGRGAAYELNRNA
jgi:ATP-dependent DNA helicase RecG